MRSGLIQAEAAEHHEGRASISYSLWEKAILGAVEFPWGDAAKLSKDEIQKLLSGARIVVLVVGTTPASRALLAATLDSLPKAARLYIYGDRALEADQQLAQKLAGMGDRVLARLGYRPPADWLVTGTGKEGRLLLGAQSGQRRWSITVDGAIARSLFEAFRVLFWFHAVREALPDEAGKVAWRTPLSPPFSDPGPRLSLAAGVLQIGVPLEDPVSDAEIRVTPNLIDPGRAATIIIPPTKAIENTGSYERADLALPTKLARRGSRVCWIELGLPRTTITRERMLMDLVEAPIELQLEWPRSIAIDLFHRIERAAQKPAWSFYEQRQLLQIQGSVLLQGSSKPQIIEAKAEIDLGDIIAEIEKFDDVKPESFLEALPLALEVVYHWRRVPVVLPQGARYAPLVQQWKALDEWAMRQVDQARKSLEQLKKEEQGFLVRLKRFLNRDASQNERRKLGDEVEELGDSRPSDDAGNAATRVRRLEEVVARIREIAFSNHEEHQKAEDSDAKEKQQAIWKTRREEALSKAEVLRSQSGETEKKLGVEREQCELIKGKVQEELTPARQARQNQLAQEKEMLVHKLEEAKRALKDLNRKHSGNPPKEEKEELTQSILKLEQENEQNQKAISTLSAWFPPTSPLQEEFKRVKAKVQEIEKTLNQQQSELHKLDRIIQEVFTFQPPERLSLPGMISVVPAPPVPAEAPPELGELFESQGRRYLAVRTWEQVPRAKPVALRLSAELVSLPPGS